jgi:hypothetical protein
LGTGWCSRRPWVIEADEIEEIGLRLQRALDDVAGDLKREGVFA